MKNLFTVASVTALMIALPATAFAETLNYNFTATINYIQDGYADNTGVGVFDEWAVGDTITGTLSLNSGQGSVVSVTGLDFEGTNTNSWSWASYSSWGNTQQWDAGGGTNGQNIVLNGVDVHSGTLSNNVWLQFGTTSTGELELRSGSLELNWGNSYNAKLKANFTQPTQPPATSVPELDPKSGMSAFALLGGGLAIALSRRRRDKFGLEF
jgi:hypothetical protein